MQMMKSRYLILTGMVLAAAASRLVPHPPNFAPVAAMALFGGACFADKRLAFAVPLAAMFLSDLVLGFGPLTPFVYGSFAATVCLGFWLRSRRTPLTVAGTAVVSSLLFFLVTNFGQWAVQFGHPTPLYPTTLTGLLECYVMGLPFYQYTLAGDLMYTAVLFGGLALIESGFPALREKRPSEPLAA
jgi:hypothetical protein